MPKWHFFHKLLWKNAVSASFFVRKRRKCWNGFFFINYYEIMPFRLLFLGQVRSGRVQLPDLTWPIRSSTPKWSFSYYFMKNMPFRHFPPLFFMNRHAETAVFILFYEKMPFRHFFLLFMNKHAEMAVFFYFVL